MFSSPPVVFFCLFIGIIKRKKRTKTSIDVPSGNPIFDILGPIWEPDAKIMVIACVYPLAGIIDKNETTNTISDGWKKNLGFKEDGELKLLRDAEVLKELSDIQNIQQKL